MDRITKDAIKLIENIFRKKDNNISIQVESLRDYAENLREKYKNLHIKRLKQGKCSVESGISFLEILNCCESIINHCLNICIAVNSDSSNKSIATKHDFRNRMYQQYQDEIHNLIKKYEKKYK